MEAENTTICCLHPGDQESQPVVWSIKLESEGVTQSLRAGDPVAAGKSGKRREREWNLFASPFVLFSQALRALVGGKAAYWAHWSKHQSPLETLSGTHPEIMFNLGTLWPRQVDTKLAIILEYSVNTVLKITYINLFTNQLMSLMP